MAELNWQTNPDGTIVLRPLVGWQAAVLGGVAVGVQMQFVRSQEQLSRGEIEVEQLVLTPDQARELAQTLRRIANLVEKPPPGGQPRT